MKKHVGCVWLMSFVLVAFCDTFGSVPDACQEGIVWPFKSYSSVALFHFNVPRQVTRATWEFAGFQYDVRCPRRKIHVWIQHGSYPAFESNLTGPFGEHFYAVRTDLFHLQVHSQYRPSNSKVFPVYNPLPGSWFAAAYMEPYEESLGLGRGCRYSLGSVGVWSLAESVELILPNRGPQTFRARDAKTYLKFFVPDDVDRFVLNVSSSNNDSIDYVGYRGLAFPFRDDDDDRAGNATASGTFSFVEERPFRSQYYYVLVVVSKGDVVFDVNVEFHGCGFVGLYGQSQRDWYMSERGLELANLSSLSPEAGKEPETGFQLFSENNEEDGGNKTFSKEKDEMHSWS